MKYTLDNVCTGNHKVDHINSRIMEFADDVAKHKAQKDWEAEGRPENFYIEETNGDLRMNAEAQEIFNEYYDAEIDNLYKLVNRCIEIHES